MTPNRIEIYYGVSQDDPELRHAVAECADERTEVLIGGPRNSIMDEDHPNDALRGWFGEALVKTHVAQCSSCQKRGLTVDAKWNVRPEGGAA